MIELYVRSETGRYREATPGEVVAAAQERLAAIGRGDIAFALTMHLLDRIGYQIPRQVEELPTQLPPEDS